MNLCFSTHYAAVMLTAVGAVASISGCGKSSPGGAPSGVTSTQAPAARPDPIPESLRGSFSKNNTTLSVTGSGLAAEQIPGWKGAAVIVSGHAQGSTYSVDDSSYSGTFGAGNCKGSIELNGRNLVVVLSGQEGCSELLSGTWAPGPADPKAQPKATATATAAAASDKPLPEPEPIPEKWRALLANLHGVWKSTVVTKKPDTPAHGVESVEKARYKFTPTDAQLGSSGRVTAIEGDNGWCGMPHIFENGADYVLNDYAGDEVTLSLGAAGLPGGKAQLILKSDKAFEIKGHYITCRFSPM